MTRIVLLGPQRRPTLDKVVRSLEIEGPIAAVTAGWLERERDDAELDGLLGGRGANLALYERWQDVLERDPELRAAETEHRAVRDELQRLYLVRLDAAMETVLALSDVTGVRPRNQAAVLADAEVALRLVDEQHLARVDRANDDFAAAWTPGERPVVAEHRESVRRILQQTGGLAVTGGNVAVLLHVLKLFDVVAQSPGTVIAWSAGAMALTDRVLLFHDWAANQPSPPEFAEGGLGVVTSVVALPHARQRLRLADGTRMGVLARRVAPARCLVLEAGMRVDLEPDGSLPAGTRVLGEDGRLATLEPVA